MQAINPIPQQNNIPSSKKIRTSKQNVQAIRNRMVLKNAKKILKRERKTIKQNHPNASRNRYLLPCYPSPFCILYGFLPHLHKLTKALLILCFYCFKLQLQLV
ncbi:hypothetical protein V8G54_033190 [Vigna mungo]|uniref:Uncharacterized protein n=1 Tax=Vigna mungo TaxID=3915 RepID=A0AAQ3MN11_VIGMU